MDRRRFLHIAGGALGLATFACRTFAQPARGGTFVQALGGRSTDTLNPADFRSEFSFSVGAGQIRNGLFELDEQNSPVPELCEEWSVSADARSWTFQVRQGIEFHNGRSLTTEDIVASLNFHRGEGNRSPVRPLLSGITEIENLGGAVRISLDQANADLPSILASPELVICPSDGDGIDWQSGAGTGPYLIEEVDPGVSALCSRNPNYWKDNAAYFDAVQSLVINDQTAATAAVASGSVNFARVTPRDLDVLPDESLVHLSIPRNQFITFPMQTDVAPFDDVNVRRALKFSINRSEIISKLFLGMGSLGNDSPIGPNNRFYASTDEIPQRSYDPDRAKFHLRQAGFDNLTIDLSVSEASFPGAPDAAALFQSSAVPAGVAINVVREPADGYWTSVWQKKPFVASSWSGRTTEDQMFSVAYDAKAPWNETRWNNDRFQTLLLNARAELNESKRSEMYVEMQSMLHDDGGSIIPSFTIDSFALDKSVVTRNSVGGTYPLDNYKNVERWAYASDTGTSGSSCRFNEKWCKKQNRCILRSEDC